MNNDMFLKGKLPVFVLPALLFFNASNATAQPAFSPILGETRIEYPTPKQASRGIDAVVTVSINTQGPRPAWLPNSSMIRQLAFNQPPKLILEQNGKSEALPLKMFSTGTWHARRQCFELQYLLKVAHLPAGKLTLQDRVALFRSITTTNGNVSHTGEPTQVSEPIDIDVFLRADGTTPSPEVSRDHGVQILSIESRPATEGETNRTRTLLPGETDNSQPIDAVARLLIDDSGPTFVWDVRRFDVVDKAGKKVDAKCDAHFENFSVLNKQKWLKLMVRWREAPPEVGPLFILGQIGRDDYWPLQVRIPIRDEAGKAVTLAATTPDNATGVKLESAPRQP